MPNFRFLLTAEHIICRHLCCLFLGYVMYSIWKHLCATWPKEKTTRASKWKVIRDDEARRQGVRIGFTFQFWAIKVMAGSNASNISSSNIANFACWMKCWTHLRCLKFTKKYKKKKKIMLDDVGWSLIAIKHLISFHPTFSPRSKETSFLQLQICNKL